MTISKPDETEEMYQKNLALLPQWLKGAVSNISEEEYREKIEVTYNAEGYPICRRCRSRTWIYKAVTHTHKHTRSTQPPAEPAAVVFWVIW
jgi:hypothetical protein